MLTRWIPPMTTDAAKELLEGGEELIPGTHYEVNESASTPGELDAECPDAAQYAIYSTSIPQLQLFRSQ